MPRKQLGQWDHHPSSVYDKEDTKPSSPHPEAKTVEARWIARAYHESVVAELETCSKLRRECHNAWALLKGERDEAKAERDRLRGLIDDFLADIEDRGECSKDMWQAMKDTPR